MTRDMGLQRECGETALPARPEGQKPGAATRQSPTTEGSMSNDKGSTVEQATEQELEAAITSAKAAAAYLREEADFNRSWTDGRRGRSRSDAPDGYIERLIELAKQREKWARAIESLCDEAAGRSALSSEKAGS